jgi:type I restriction enzyme S subunit
MFGDPVTNPKGWPEAALTDAAEIVSGVTKGRHLDGKQTVFAPYLRVANVQDGYLNLSEIKEIEVLPTDIAKYRLLGGDILLTEGGDPDKLGRGTVWREHVDNCIHQNHIFRVRITTDNLLPDFLSVLIGSERGKRYFLRAAKQTTGIASINSTQLKNFPLLIPPLDLQQRFAHCVVSTNRLYKRLIETETNTGTLFNSLMQLAFKGKL